MIVLISGTSNSSRRGRARSRRRGPRRAAASRPPASPRRRSRAHARRRRSSSPAPRWPDRRACSTARSGSRKSSMPCHDRVVGPRDVDPVVDDVAGMGDPLAAAHELVFGRVAERIAHAAVIAGEADAAAHGAGEIGDLLLLDLRHGVDRHDQAQVRDAPGRRRPRSWSRRGP